MTDWLQLMDDVAPLSIQESWDNSGLQIDYGNEEVERILVALEITGDVIEEAISKTANMIVVHHPLIFEPIRKIDYRDMEGDYILRLIRSGISVYAAHTCFDSARNGNNDHLMELLGIQRFSRLNMPGRGFEDSTLARIGTLPESMLFSRFLERLDRALGHPGGIKVSGDPARLIRKVAVCCGGGGEYYQGALAAGADVFISGDIKHHEAQKARESGLCVVDAGHYGTEKIFVQNMAQQLKQKGAGALTVICSEVMQNPYDFIL
jgi:dinuclear metal center YbgI/SA1388 family protein